MVKIGYLGPQGSFSEEALRVWLTTDDSLFLKDQPEVCPYPSIPSLLLACERSEIEWAFVPLENSIDGQVGATLDTLNQTENLVIYREYVHPISQCLLTVHPTVLDQIKRIFSHEQALGQCRDFIEKNMPQAEQITCLSTAEAAAALKTHAQGAAAIGPRRAAEIYDLVCLQEQIQDVTANATRFILVGHRLSDMSTCDKTSFLFATANSPGSLSAVLQEFSKRQINMTRIESRPSKQLLGEYIFFIDVDGYVFTPALQEALWALKEINVQVKLLGSYPKYHFSPTF